MHSRLRSAHSANGAPVLDTCIGVLAVRRGVSYAPISPITLSLTKGNVRGYFVVSEAVGPLNLVISLKIRRYQLATEQYLISPPIKRAQLPLLLYHVRPFRKGGPPSPRKPPTPSSFFHRLKSSVLLFPVELPPFKLSDSPFIQAGANQKIPLGFISIAMIYRA